MTSKPGNYRADAAIVGVGQTEYSKASGRSELQLAAEASRAALTDAGVDPASVDGMVTFLGDSTNELELMRCLGVQRLRYSARSPHGGQGSCASVQLAASAVASGAAETVLMYRAFNERSGLRFGQERNRPGVADNWYWPYGLDTPAKGFALTFHAYMHRSGVTNEDLGHYSVIARKHAASNPAAWFYQRPITLADHQQSRWIVEPVLRLLDCCQESDGGTALVITRADRARDLDVQPVAVVAASNTFLCNTNVIFDYHQPDISQYNSNKAMAEQLWAAAELGPGDMQAAMIYENFSPIVFMQLEASGFCGRGEAKDFIAAGEIEIGGKLPVNTNGGLLGEAYIHGVNNIIEAVRQLRGTAANQVADVEHVAVLSGTSGLVLGRD